MNDTETLVDSKKWERMIRTIMRTFLPACHKSTLITPEDMYQEAWIGLLKAAKSYDPNHEKGCKFTTFAWIAVYGSIRRYVERAVDHELPRSNETNPSILPSPTVNPAEAVEAADMVERIEAIITPQEAEILYLRYVERHTFRKISQILGNISHQGVDNKCKAIRKRVEERFQDE